MNPTPANCPHCNSEQAFKPKLRQTDERWQEEYIVCSVCRWDRVIRHTTDEIEEVRTKLRGLSARAQWEIDRHGHMSGTISVKRREAHKQLSQLIGELAKERREVNGPAAHPDAA